jgi:hypothetical protein
MSSDIDKNYENNDPKKNCFVRMKKTIKTLCRKKHRDPPPSVHVIPKLNIMCMMSNPIGFKRRVHLAKRFIDRMNERNDINLYIAEIVYDDGKYEITDKNCPNHLQLKSHYPMWHKENAINVLVSRMLKDDWRCFCWIDMDIIFENKHWVEDTLEVLNTDTPTFAQLFSHAVDMDRNENPMSIFQGFGYQYYLGKNHETTKKGFDYWHPGYAWGMNRAAYDITGGLYDRSIIGSGDYNMAMSLINKGCLSVDKRTSEGYKKDVEEYQRKCVSIKLKHVPGVIRHEYHGSKVNRKYVQRNDIIIKHQYDPSTFIRYGADGLIEPAEKFTKEFLDEIFNYFVERNEDEAD